VNNIRFGRGVDTNLMPGAGSDERGKQRCGQSVDLFRVPCVVIEVSDGQYET